MITLYGIPNCGSMKKAFQWLTENGLNYHFHDYKKKGISTDVLVEWIKQVGVSALVNRSGTTWRKLSAEQQNAAGSAESAPALLTEYTSLLRRPIITDDSGKILTLGFSELDYQRLFRT